MSLRKPLIALVVFLALLGLWRLEQKRLARNTERREENQRLFTFEPEEVTRLRLHNEHGDFALERRDSVWWIVEPMETRADADQISATLQNLRGAKRRNVFTPRDSLESYGLSAPETWVELEAGAGAQGKARRVRVEFGSPAAQNYQVYARVEGEDAIFTLSDYSKSQCRKNLFTLRDKSLLAAAPENVERIELAGPSLERAFAIARDSSEAQWRLEPGGRAADPEEVNNWLRALLAARATRILDSPATAPEEFALTSDTAQLVIRLTLSTAAGAPPVALHFGRAEEGENPDTYCRVGEEPRFLLVRSALLKELRKAPRDFRDRRLAPIPPTALRAVRLTASRRAVSFSRPAPEAPWRFDSPEGEYPPAERKIAALLRDLCFLQGKELLAEAEEADPVRLALWGLDEPILQARLHSFDSATTSGFDIGEPEGEQGIVYTRRLSDGAVLAVDFRRVTELFKFRDSLEDRALLTFTPGAVERVELDFRGGEGEERVFAHLTRGKQIWRVKTSDGKRRSLDAFTVEGFLDDLASLEFAGPFAPAEGAPPGDRGGLDAPEIRIALYTADDAAPAAALSVGRREGARRVMGASRAAAPETAYLVDAETVANFTRALERLLTQLGQSPPEDSAPPATP